jgi:Phosphodiester glycosidase
MFVAAVSDRRINGKSRLDNISRINAVSERQQSSTMKLFCFPRFFCWTAFFAALPLQAEWVQRQSHIEQSVVPSVVHQHLVLANPESATEATLDLAKFSQKSCRVRLIDNADGDRSLAIVMAATNCLAGVNGGYFDENFAPLGLRVVDGKMFRPLVHGRLLTGIFSFSNGQARIARLNEFSRGERTVVALQTGPFLVDHGRVVAGLDVKRPARRSFVAMTAGGEVWLGCSSELSLAELSELLGKGTGDVRIQRALNLDGGSSTGFWFKRKDGTVFSIPEQKPVREFIGITTK